MADVLKKNAQKHPHKMDAIEKTSQSHISSMVEGDFWASEHSTTNEGESIKVDFNFTPSNGAAKTKLKSDMVLQPGEILDSKVMSVSHLRSFLEAQMKDARDRNVLFSLHMKATMMKASDPVIFGHAVSVFYRPVFEKHAALFQDLGVNPNFGINDVYTKIKGHPQESTVKADIEAVYAMENIPKLAMVNSEKGITHLHQPNLVIVDTSMPTVMRDGGKIQNPDGKLEDAKCVIPDRTYAGIYVTAMEYIREHGQLDVTTMGTMGCVIGCSIFITVTHNSPMQLIYR